MKRIKKVINLTVFLLCVFVFAGFTHAQEVDNKVTGEIRELVDTDHIIMVNDHNYIVIAVFVDDGLSKEPLAASFNDLQVGNIVEIYASGNKSDGFWTAEKVILLTGEKEKEFKNRSNENE
jgi:hypothetical protein